MTSSLSSSSGGSHSFNSHQTSFEQQCRSSAMTTTTNHLKEDTTLYSNKINVNANEDNVKDINKTNCRHTSDNIVDIASVKSKAGKSNKTALINQKGRQQHIEDYHHAEYSHNGTVKTHGEKALSSPYNHQEEKNTKELTSNYVVMSEAFQDVFSMFENINTHTTNDIPTGNNAGGEELETERAIIREMCNVVMKTMNEPSAATMKQT